MGAIGNDLPALNTDREIWRRNSGALNDYYEPSIHVTKGDGIGINVGGKVYVKTVQEWHRLAGGVLGFGTASAESQATIGLLNALATEQARQFAHIANVLRESFGALNDRQLELKCLFKNHIELQEAIVIALRAGRRALVEKQPAKKVRPAGQRKGKR